MLSEEEVKVAWEHIRTLKGSIVGDYYCGFNNSCIAFEEDEVIIDKLIKEHFELKEKYSKILDDVQLTVEEIESLSRYYQGIMKIISRNMLNIFEIAYTVDNYDLELCVKAIDKLQKQKEMLENER